VEFTDYLADVVGLVIEKQRRFADMVGERGWWIDTDQRLLSFRDDQGATTHTFQADLLAMEWPKTRQVQWAWSMETKENPSEAARARSAALRVWGEERKFTEFTTVGWYTDTVRTAVRATTLAAGVLNADAFFVATDPTGDAIGHYALSSPMLALGPVDLTKSARVVLDIAEHYPVPHRRAVVAYLEDRGMDVSQPMGRVVGTTNTSAKIRVMFDDFGRIANLQGDFALPEGVKLSNG
jgi:hypothetical protein